VIEDRCAAYPAYARYPLPIGCCALAVAARMSPRRSIASTTAEAQSTASLSGVFEELDPCVIR
jgi:hypothetical protein